MAALRHVPSAGGPPSADDLRVATRPRHWGTHVGAVVAFVLIGSLTFSFATNSRVRWSVVGDYLFSSPVLHGVLVTLELTVLAMAIGAVGAITLAIMRDSGNPVLGGIAWLYQWFFRGTPLLVQIIFWGFLGAVYPSISLGIPGTDLTLASASSNSVITPFVAALLGLGLNEAAYDSEIVRAGLLSIDEGQREAAHALGMSPALTMRKIILPQALRVVVPPMGNQTIGMLKMTSLVSVIAGTDLLTRVQSIYSQNFEVIPLLVVASLWYLALTTILSIGQVFLERRLGQGVRRRVRGG
ncbi:MAG TPA: amino acid ABC transporter permease [Solirubrobacteraceae bacterium]|jgi:polar amino acid transport system permease protein|nr:amino acid ABC transporter permease [Solirubrobacteraceae bacterium]